MIVYVPPFWLGVAATLITEIALVVAWVAMRQKKPNAS